MDVVHIVCAVGLAHDFKNSESLSFHKMDSYSYEIDCPNQVSM